MRITSQTAKVMTKMFLQGSDMAEIAECYEIKQETIENAIRKHLNEEIAKVNNATSRT